MRRSSKRLAQEQMEAAAGGETPRTPTSARGAEAAAADTAPVPINAAFKAVMEVPPLTGPACRPAGADRAACLSAPGHAGMHFAGPLVPTCCSCLGALLLRERGGGVGGGEGGF